MLTGKQYNISNQGLQILNYLVYINNIKVQLGKLMSPPFIMFIYRHVKRIKHLFPPFIPQHFLSIGMESEFRVFIIYMSLLLNKNIWFKSVL